MNSHLLPTDIGWTEDKALMADLSRLNSEITRYILSYLTADAGQAEPISTDDEQTFGHRLIEMGKRVQHWATRCAAHTTGNSPVIEGKATQPPVLEPGQRPGAPEEGEI